MVVVVTAKRVGEERRGKTRTKEQLIFLSFFFPSGGGVALEQVNLSRWKVGVLV